MEEILQKANAYEDQGVLVTNILFDVFFLGLFPEGAILMLFI